MTDPRELLDAYGRKNTIVAAPPGDTTCEGYWTELQDVAPKAFAALRAVLDRHKPQQAAHMKRCDEHADWMLDPDADCPGDCPKCESIPFLLCTCARRYPCQTVQDITVAMESQ